VGKDLLVFIYVSRISHEVSMMWHKFLKDSPRL
jgi:hypothetical protein